MDHKLAFETFYLVVETLICDVKRPIEFSKAKRLSENMSYHYGKLLTTFSTPKLLFLKVSKPIYLWNFKRIQENCIQHEKK